MFTVTLSGAAATAQVISYSLDGGTTVAGTVTIPAGEFTETITVPTTPDGIFGSAAGPVTVTLAGGASDTIILTDAEAAPSVSIAGDAETVVEGQAAVFTVTLSGAAATAQVISYSLDGGTTVAGTVTIPAGELTETITVPTTPDGTPSPLPPPLRQRRRAGHGDARRRGERHDHPDGRGGGAERLDRRRRRDGCRGASRGVHRDLVGRGRDGAGDQLQPGRRHDGCRHGHDPGRRAYGSDHGSDHPRRNLGSAAGPVTVTLAGGASDTIILTDAEAAPSVSIAGDAETVVEGQAAVFTVTLSGAAATAQVISYSLDGGTTVAARSRSRPASLRKRSRFRPPPTGTSAAPPGRSR